MKIVFEGSCQKVVFVEALLLVTGKMKKDEKGKRITHGKVMPVEEKSNTMLWYEQQSYRSPTFTKKYLLTLDDRLRYLCRWFPVKFYYDMRYEYANLQCLQEDYDKLKFLVEDQGFNLLKQENPEEAERISQLAPKGILESLERKEVDNGKAI